MTRHDYRIIAAALKKAREELDHPVGYELQGNFSPHCANILDDLEEAWVTLFAKENPHFSPTKFKEALQP